MGKSITVRDASESDHQSIAEIYNYYVLNTTITFEEEVVTISEMGRRVESVRSAGLPWIVLVLDQETVGYAYATLWKTRSAYRFSVETTVYVAVKHVGQGIGSVLYEHLLNDLRTRKIHSVIAGIALPSPHSIALHEKFGFRNVARFHEVGFKFSQWLDVGYWQKSLEVDESATLVVESSIQNEGWRTGC
jgi:L-amino acid N-acyltransferase YncA